LGLTNETRAKNGDEIPDQKLCRAVELGYQRMQAARDARYKFLAQYVGPFYSRNKGTDGSDERKASPDQPDVQRGHDAWFRTSRTTTPAPAWPLKYMQYRGYGSARWNWRRTT
jgi:hypothetical protein